MHSDNLDIYENYTATGKPMLANKEKKREMFVVSV